MEYEQKRFLIIYTRKIILENLLVLDRGREVMVIQGGEIMGLTKHSSW